MKLRLSERSKADLDQIFVQGVERYGERAVEVYLHEIAEKFTLLLAFPLSNPLRSEIRPPVRLQTHKGHVIVYRVETQYVDIIRVLSRFQNWRDEA
jgi:toxin ParE1/3/4